MVESMASYIVISMSLILAFSLISFVGTAIAIQQECVKAEPMALHPLQTVRTFTGLMMVISLISIMIHLPNM